MFDKLAGNDGVKQTLRRLIAGRRVPNSLLFAGDDGVGKFQFALEIAKAFVCIEPRDGEGCDVCSACKRAERFELSKSEKGDDYDRVFFSEHLDVGVVIPFNRNVRIGAIRALEREANFNPYESSARFLIVVDAEKMADPAANALLKTLEEPPTTSHIFLITSRPDSLLPTIRSRCQTLRFAPVSFDEIEEFLIKERAFSPDEARLAARLSRGSVGRAVSIKIEQFRTQRERMLAVIGSAIETGDLAAMLRTSEELNDAKNKDAYEENIDILQSLIHDVWSLAIELNDSRVVNTDVIARLKQLAEKALPQNLAAWLGEIDTLRENLIVNLNRKIATDSLFVSMAGGGS